VLAAAVAGIAGSLSASYKQSAVHADSAVALDLARELMEEISSKTMDPPAGTTNAVGWPTVKDRRLYDTIDDYKGYHDTSTVTTSTGSTLDAGNGETFTRYVEVTSGARPTGLTGTTTDFSMVRVTVTMSSGQTVQLSQLFTRAVVVR